MNKREFSELFAARYGMPKYRSKDICSALFDLLGECILNNDRVYITGFGTFKRKYIKEGRVGIGGKPGETQVVPPHYRYSFVLTETPDMPKPEDDERYE